MPPYARQQVRREKQIEMPGRRPRPGSYHGIGPAIAVARDGNRGGAGPPPRVKAPGGIRQRAECIWFPGTGRRPGWGGLWTVAIDCATRRVLRWPPIYGTFTPPKDSSKSGPLQITNPGRLQRRRRMAVENPSSDRTVSWGIDSTVRFEKVFSPRLPTRGPSGRIGRVIFCFPGEKRLTPI